MGDSVTESLILDLLEWLVKRDRSYEEVMDPIFRLDPHAGEAPHPCLTGAAWPQTRSNNAVPYCSTCSTYRVLDTGTFDSRRRNSCFRSVKFFCS